MRKLLAVLLSFSIFSGAPSALAGGKVQLVGRYKKKTLPRGKHTRQVVERIQRTLADTLRLKEGGFEKSDVTTKNLGLLRTHLEKTTSVKTGPALNTLQKLAVALGHGSGQVKRQEITVRNIQEFIGALGSHRTLLLEPGDYWINQLDRKSKGPHHSFGAWIEGEERQDWKPTMLFIKNLAQVTIKAKRPDRRPRLVTTAEDDTVLVFFNNQGLRLEGLWIGHETSTESCTGGVVYFEKGKNISLHNCHLYGSGYFGFEAHQVHGLTFEDSQVSGCTGNIFGLYKCGPVRVRRSVFEGNSSSGHFSSIMESQDVRFEEVRFVNNRWSFDSALDDQALIFSLGPSTVTMSKSVVKGSHTEVFWLYQGHEPNLEQVSFKDNTFTNGRMKQQSE